ncbi:MAG: hypothetical protein EOO77_35165 [Oxalobacteraceae bacterium]|nr:MAG: hypothetical protein EOO77_35165 [Oxalobacteraceae bacterium]
MSSESIQLLSVGAVLQAIHTDGAKVLRRLTYVNIACAMGQFRLFHPGPAPVLRVSRVNTRNMLIRDEVMSRGTLDQAAVHVREVVRRALELGSSAIILVHNYPSGDSSPSRADIDITRAIVTAGKPLNIAVHDHLIIGTSGHISLRAQGLI